MLIVPNEEIRKYLAYSIEDGGWIHDPNMPETLEAEFQKFKQLAEVSLKSPITEESIKKEENYE